MGIGSRAVRVGVVLVALATAAVAVPAAWAAPTARAQVSAEMLQLLGGLRRQYSAPGAGFTFGDGTHEASLSSGTRRLPVNEPIASTDKVRVGSDTKMFVAAVVLQLQAEGRLDLDAPLDRYLPGVLRYPANKVPGDPARFDGRAVTLRQLLQHTAGVPEYADLPFILDPRHQLRPPTDPELVAHALPNGPTFRPGSAFRYSNTGYILLGMVVRARTGHSIGAEITRRIVKPLGLRNSFFAGPGDKSIPGEHVSGYLTAAAPIDVTYFEPAIFGAAGAMVASPRDMDTFLSALLAGRVVPPAQLAEMQHTVPMGGGAGYGLGLVGVPLSCGTAWGHAGQVAGYQTFGLAVPNGRHAFMTMNSTYPVNLVPPSPPVSAYDLFELALC